MVFSRDRSLIFDQLWKTSTASPWVLDHDSDILEVVDHEVHPHEVAAVAGKLAAELSASGIDVGDRCGVWIDSPIDTIVCIAALTAIGAVPVLLTPQMSADQLRAVTAAPLDPLALLVTTVDRVPRDGPISTERRIDTIDALCGRARRRDPIRQSVALPDSAPYVVTHTSGTTGVNKLVEYCRRAVDQDSYVQELPAKYGRLRGYVASAISPVHFRAVAGLLAALRRGLPLLILANDDPALVGPFLRRWKPTYLETHPNTYIRWEVLAETGALRSVKYFLSTFDVIHPATVQRLLAGSRYRRAILIEVYGQSEIPGAAWRIHFKVSPFRARHKMTGHLIGWSIPGHTRIRVVDANNVSVPRGTPGRIVIRTRGKFTTYLNLPEAAKNNLLEGNWWDTGDWGFKDRWGRLTLIDRQVERMSLIPSAIAVEDVLLERIPALQEAVLLESNGALVPVVVVRGQPFDADAWSEAVEDLPPMRAPVVVSEEDIPRTSTGKVQREVLRTALADERSS